MMREAVVDYRKQAWDFLEKSRMYLSGGDLHQASEKGWGAAAHMARAVAAARGWEYETHDQFFTVMDNAGHFAHHQRQVSRLSSVANKLHGNYYKREMLLNSDTTAGDLDDVAELLTLLEPLTE